MPTKGMSTPASKNCYTSQHAGPDSFASSQQKSKKDTTTNCLEHPLSSGEGRCLHVPVQSTEISLAAYLCLDKLRGVLPFQQGSNSSGAAEEEKQEEMRPKINKTSAKLATVQSPWMIMEVAEMSEMAKNKINVCGGPRHRESAQMPGSRQLSLSKTDIHAKLMLACLAWSLTEHSS